MSPLGRRDVAALEVERAHHVHGIADRRVIRPEVAFAQCDHFLLERLGLVELALRFEHDRQRRIVVGRAQALLLAEATEHGEAEATPADRVVRATEAEADAEGQIGGRVGHQAVVALGLGLPHDLLEAGLGGCIFAERDLQ